MNNNDILSGLYSDTEKIQPSDRLNPSAIESSLKGVKRKSHKGVVGSFVTLGVACMCAGAVVITQLSSPVKTSYDDVYRVVDTIKKENEVSLLDKFGDYLQGNFGEVTEDIYYENAYDDGFKSNSMNDFATGAVDPGASDYSKTNAQVEGVDEADVVKTDGRYIYSLCDDEIFITNPNNGKPELVTSIGFECDIDNMYISGNKLVAVTECYSSESSTEDTIPYYNSRDYLDSTTALIVYDLSNITTPERMSVLTQSGSCISTRKIGDVVYLTTSYSIDDYNSIKKNKPETYCPVYSVDGKEECVAADSILICDEVDSIDYVTVASVDLNSPDKFADMCSVLGGGDEVYASLNNIYITSYCQVDSQTKTQIMRFSVNGTEIEKNGSLYVDGSILNQFSMDEYNGYFRVVTEFTPTQVYENSVAINLSDTVTALYIYDNELNLVGKTDNVAESENVKSVRFDGDIAYFVTFRQTDPLFTVDLSEPTAPKILSELKIPGFSEYLHVMSEDLLLGFGREADPLTGITDGLKLSMFDISDKTDVTEKTTLVFTDYAAYSEAEYNHKAIYVDEENKIIGIPYAYYTNSGDSSLYAVFKYDEAANKFVPLEEFFLGNCDDMSYYPINGYSFYSRGLRIGNCFYIVTDNTIYSYNYSDFQEISSLKLG